MTVYVDQKHSLIALADFLDTTLPAAGAFVTGNADVPRGTRYVTFWISYTRGAAGGAPVFRASSRPSPTATWKRMPLVDQSSLAPSPPNASQNFYQEDHNGPVPGTGDPNAYDLTFRVPSNTVGVQLEVAERGVPATPGTILVEMTGAG